jgi:peptide deformylase
MSLLNILQYPDPRLRTIAAPVQEFGPELKQFCEDLLETMYEAPGIGLAATQVNVHKRVIAVDVSESRSEPFVFVNPSLELHGELFESEEGCLSVPGIYEPVTRAERITVTAVDPQGEAFSIDAEGLLAVCIQHECDHLQGKLFVDYLSSLKRNRIRKKLLKQQKQRA